MSSIASKIYDEEKLHGSWEAYVAHVENNNQVLKEKNQMQPIKFGDLQEGQIFTFREGSPSFTVRKATERSIVYGNDKGPDSVIIREGNQSFMERDVYVLTTDDAQFKQVEFGTLREDQIFAFKGREPLFIVRRNAVQGIAYSMIENGVVSDRVLYTEHPLDMMRIVNLRVESFLYSYADLAKIDNALGQKDWEAFREAGMLFVANQMLHFFGWAITVEVENGEVKDVKPHRVKFRGFDDQSQSEQYAKVAKYLEANATELRKEAEL